MNSISAHKLSRALDHQETEFQKVFFSISLPNENGDDWCVAYRSEAVNNCANNVWMPIDQSELCHFKPWANADQVLIKFYLFSSGSALTPSPFNRPRFLIVDEDYGTSTQCILEAKFSLSGMKRIRSSTFQNPFPLSYRSVPPNSIIVEFSTLANEYGVYSPELDPSLTEMVSTEEDDEPLDAGRNPVLNNLDHTERSFDHSTQSLDAFRKQVESIIALRKQIYILQQRRLETCKWLQSHAGNDIDQFSMYEQGNSKNAVSVISALKEQRFRVMARYESSKVTFEETQKQVAQSEKMAVAAGQALISTLQTLQMAHKRITTGQSTLQGQEGHGRLQGAVKELIGRRCLMTLQAANVLRFAPSTVRVIEVGGQLDSCLDAQWTGSPVETRVEIYHNPSTRAPRSMNDANLLNNYRVEMKLTVLGMTLNPAVWKHAFDPEGYEWDTTEDRNAAVVLGIVAALVDRLAVYLSVPLRYPLLLRGSTSSIMDNYPPIGYGTGMLSFMEAKAGEQSTMMSMQQRQSRLATKKARNHGNPVEYPLYCQSNRDRPRFAVGVFLLNKNVIQLLQSHGMSSTGPNQLLQNLHMLIAAAQAGLPPGHEGFEWIQP